MFRILYSYNLQLYCTVHVFDFIAALKRLEAKRSEQCANNGHLQCGTCSCRTSDHGPNCQCSYDTSYTDDRKECRNRCAA